MGVWSSIMAGLDIEIIVKDYIGRQKLQRLHHIASIYPQYKEEASLLALSYIHRDESCNLLDKNLYDSFLSMMKESDMYNSILEYSKEWNSIATKRIDSIYTKITKEIELVKEHSIQESIRTGYQELGQFYHRCGHLSDAVKAYLTAMDYCALPTHLLEIYYPLIRIYLEQKDLTSLLHWGTKAVQLYHSERYRLRNIPKCLILISHIYTMMGLVHLQISMPSCIQSISFIKNDTLLSLKDAMQCFVHAILCASSHNSLNIQQSSQCDTFSMEDDVLSERDLLSICLLCFFSISSTEQQLFQFSDELDTKNTSDISLRLKHFESFTDLCDLIRSYSMGNFHRIIRNIQQMIQPSYKIDMFMCSVIDQLVRCIQMNFLFCYIGSYQTIYLEFLTTRLCYESIKELLNMIEEFIMHVVDSNEIEESIWEKMLHNIRIDYVDLVLYYHGNIIPEDHNISIALKSIRHIKNQLSFEKEKDLMINMIQSIPNPIHPCVQKFSNESKPFQKWQYQDNE